VETDPASYQHRPALVSDRSATHVRRRSFFTLLLLATCTRSRPSPPEAAAPVAQTRFAETRGVRLHYLDWGGTGDALVFVPGLGSTAHALEAADRARCRAEVARSTVVELHGANHWLWTTHGEDVERRMRALVSGGGGA
jgi:pimeloyl-ACP methyl ester carboxylesterase